MRLEVKVIAGAKRNSLKADSTPVKIYLTAPAVEGKANKALVDFLSDHYKTTKSNISIIKGLKSRRKTINIEGI